MFPILLWRSVALLALQKAWLAPCLLVVLCLTGGLSQADGSEAKGHQGAPLSDDGVSYAGTPEDQARACAAKIIDQTHADPNAARRTCECLVESFPRDKEPIIEAYIRGGGGVVSDEMKKDLEYWMSKADEMQKCRFAGCAGRASIYEACEFDAGWDAAFRGDHDSAIEHYTRYIEFNPDRPTPLVNRARAYLESGRYDQAKADFTQTIQLAPMKSDAYRYLALAYHRAGRDTEAFASRRQGHNPRGVPGV